jgi:hypothetical protein
MEHYAGLNVSLERPPSAFSTGPASKVIWRGRCSSDPDAIVRTVSDRAPFAVCIGLETGQFSTWLIQSKPVRRVSSRHENRPANVGLRDSSRSNDGVQVMMS